MTPDAASTQPRKRAWKRWTLGLACVVAVVTIVLLATPPKPEPVKVWFVRATNEFGVKKLVFHGSNGVPWKIVHYAEVITNMSGPPKTLAGVRPFSEQVVGVAEAGESFTFSVYVPPKDVPYQVMWAFLEAYDSATRWNRFRMACYNFFYAHGMPALARTFEPRVHMHYIPSTEIKE